MSCLQKPASEELMTYHDCHRTLSSTASLQQHREKYCRYREGKKAKRSVVFHQRDVEIDDGDIEFWSDDSHIAPTHVSINGRTRDYMMLPSDGVVDAERWLSAEEALVRCIYDEMNEFLVRSRLVLKAWFAKRNHATFEALIREEIYRVISAC